ncbi:MAG: YcgN family cysteine cluster protein [Pseudomonadota bacterium]
MGKTKRPFWEEKTLEQMTKEEWEQLCDGCGRCCLEKLEDEDTGEVHYTSVACRYLDTWTCRCLDYPDRIRNMPDCLMINPKMIREIHWLPKTCAYRRILEGKGLADWHPVVSGNRESVHHAGISVRNKVISANHVMQDDLEAYIIDTEI